MPEIAEVRLIADNISFFLKGNKITNISLLDPKINWAKKNAVNLAEFQQILSKTPQLVSRVNTRGKFCWIELEGETNPSQDNKNKWWIMIQFGMSGNIRKEPTEDYLKIFNKNQKKPVTMEQYLKSCHLKIDFTKQDNTTDTIYYHDIRRFGRWVFTNDPDIFNQKLNKLGHDPLQQPLLTDVELVARFRMHNYKNICKVLMDQEAVFSGVGNYIKSETLYAAKVYPFADVKDISDEALMNIYKAFVKIANDAYKSGGASLYTYTGMHGDQTDFKNTLKIYKRAIDPLGNPVKHVPDKESPDRRATSWVPKVQTIGQPLSQSQPQNSQSPTDPANKITIKRIVPKDKIKIGRIQKL